MEEEDLRKEGEANCIDGVPKTHTLKRAELEFTKLQQLGLEINHDTTCYYFGDFVARQPFVDEEYWVLYFHFLLRNLFILHHFDQ